MKKLINWFKQYGYYYKYVFITIILAVILLTIGFVSCVSKTDYDLVVILSGDFYIYDTEVHAYQNVFSEYIDDWNGDGEVNVQVMGLSTRSGNEQLDYSYEQRFRGEVLTGEVILFITDEKKYDSLDNVGGVANAEEYLPEGYPETKFFNFSGSSFAKKVEAEYAELFGSVQTPTKIQDGLRIYLRTPAENAEEDEEYKENYKRVADLFTKIANE